MAQQKHSVVEAPDRNPIPRTQGRTAARRTRAKDQAPSASASEPSGAARILPVSGTARWLAWPLGKGLGFAVTGFLAAYLLLCLWDGFAWSTRLSPTYGLFVIRLVVVAVLSAVDALAMPFREPQMLLRLLENSALLFIPLGIAHALTLSPRADRERPFTSGPKWGHLFLLGMLVFMVLYYVDGQGDLITSYLPRSPVSAWVLFLSGAVLLARNVYISWVVWRETRAVARAPRLLRQRLPLEARCRSESPPWPDRDFDPPLGRARR